MATAQRETAKGRKRNLAAVMVAALALWGVVTVSLAGMMRESNPALVLQLGGGDGLAQAGLARKLVANGNLTMADEAEGLAQSAIRKEPVAVDAYQTLGVIALAQGASDRSRALLAYAGMLSKRDFKTEVLLLAQAAQNGDVAELLYHYDNALSVHHDSWAKLIPPVAQALRDPGLVRPLSEVLSRGPSWRDSLLSYAARQPDAHDNLSRLFDALDASTPPPGDGAMQAFISRLVEAGRYELAAHRYRRATHIDPGRGLRNGGFDRPSRFEPFDWNFAAGIGFSFGVGPAPGAGNNPALQVYYTAVPPASTPRQLIFLAPGAYEIRGRAYFDSLGDGPAPAWRVRCAERSLEIGLGQPNGELGRWRTFTGTLRVPATGCGAQWIILTPGRAQIDANVSGYFDDLAIIPQPNR